MEINFTHLEGSIYLGDFGDRECLMTALVSVDESISGLTSVRCSLESVKVWNPKTNAYVDFSDWIDSPKIRQSLESEFEDLYLKQMEEGSNA